MGAALYNFKLNAGQAFRLPIQLKLSDGTPKDFTGWDFKSEIRDDTTNELLATAIIESRTDAQGLVTLAFPAEDTALLSATEANYDAVAIIPGQTDPEGLLYGKATIIPRVTAV